MSLMMKVRRFFGLSPAPSDDFWYMTPGQMTAAGIKVDENVALTYSACWAATMLLQSCAAMIPLKLFRRLPGGGSEPAADLRKYTLVHDQFNPDMTNVAFRSGRVAHQINWGNGYGEIVFDGAGRPVAIYPIHASRIPVATNIKRDEQGLYYLVNNDDGTKAKLRAWQVLHVPSLMSDDGIIGMGVVTHARLSIGFGIATETQGAAYMGNSARPTVVIEGGKFKDRPDREEFRRQWAEVHGGPANNAKPALLPPESKLHTLSFSAEDSQFLQTRQHNIEEVARWYGVPPHLIGHLLRSTYNNIEHQSLEFVKYSLMRWLVPFEQELDRKLLSAEERKTLFFRHVVDGLERGDLQTRTMAGKEQFFNGKITLNEWRGLDDQNPIGPLGDIHWVQQAMVPLEIAAKGPQQPEQPAPKSDDEPQPADDPASAEESDDEMATIKESQRLLASAMIQATMGRMIAKEVKGVIDIAQSAKRFDARLREFYEKHAATMRRELSAPMTAAFNGSGEQKLEWLVSSHIAESLKQLDALTTCTADQLAVKVDECVSRWHEERTNVENL